MARNRTEYMREYRARKQTAAVADESIAYDSTVGLHAAEARVAELEAEVKRLKVELAKRPTLPEVDAGLFKVMTRVSPTPGFAPHSFGAPRPAPKPGKH
jgi:uncharacterized small protein (DUF1192 family)